MAPLGTRDSGLGTRDSGRTKPVSLSSLDGPAFAGEELVEAFALVALQLEDSLGNLAPGAAGLLQFFRESLQKRRVLRQAVDHGHPLARGRVGDVQPRRDPRRDRLARRLERAGAVTVVGRPPALRTHPPLIARINSASLHALGNLRPLTLDVRLPLQLPGQDVR